MLQITIPGEEELFDEDAQEFIDPGAVTLRLEHSLFSLSKWESKFEKPFISRIEKTPEEMLEYIQMMCLDDFPPGTLHRLSEENAKEITKYINAPNTATKIKDDPNAKPNREIITAEIIYFWMVSMRIPWEAQHWHLNRLLTLIRVCNEKTQKPKKMGRGEVLRRNRELNEQRRQQYGTTG